MELHNAGGKPLSEQDMIEKYKVDTDKRDVDKMEHSNRETPVKRADGEIAHILNHRTLLKLVRKYPEFFDEMKPFIEKFISSEPPKRDYPEKEGWDMVEEDMRRASKMLETTIWADTHIGKQSKESIKTRKRKLIEADNELSDKMGKFASNRQLFVILGDYFHSDGSNRTTKGIPMETSMDEYDAWKEGVELLAEVLYNRSGIVDIDVIIAQGNHSRHKEMYMRDLLHYYFQNNDKINVQEIRKNGRYYYKRGKNLLGFTHGHNAKPAELPGLMNVEGPNAKMKERYQGHHHKNYRQSYHGMQINSIGAMSSLGGRNDKMGVDHRTNQIYGVLHDKNDGKQAEFYQKIK